MSKTFNSIEETRQLHVSRLGEDCVTLVINYKDAGRSGITLPPSDAPALALAILETAGVEATDMPEDPTHWNDPEALESLASWCLRQSIELKARANAEAKEREELEAEAKAFFTIYTESYGLIANWDAEEERLHDRWISFARKARELAKGSGE